MKGGLGLFWLVPILVGTAASFGASVAQKKLFGPHGEELSPYEYRLMQESQAKKKNQELVLIGAGGLLLVVLLVAVTR